MDWLSATVVWLATRISIEDGSVLDNEGNPTYTESCIKYNPGNGTVMGDDWNTKVKFAVSIGVSLYY